MKKYIECEAVKEKLQPAVNDPDSVDFWEWQCSEIDTIPAADVVARDCYNRILAENDTMREQLAKIGKKPGDSMDNVRPVVRGKWNYHGMVCGLEKLNCSICGCNSFKRGNFCSSCGADMREVTT